MSAAALDWANLLIRWFHVIAGIWWIGSSLYFVWLDNSFEPPKEARDGVDGETFMVHGGFYYLVEKRRMQPGKMPEKLHWFKWEATFTWISGMMLLAVAYYFTGGGSSLIDKNVADLTVPMAVGASLALVLGCWLLYDLMWQTVGKANETVGTALSIAGLVGLAYGLTHLFSGRAAFIHFGAILGTIMVANVWIRILPGQKKMLDDAMAGRTPDYSQGKYAKVRSVHNSYMTFPVIFMMISNHYASTFGNPYNWIVILLLFILGAGIRHHQITSERGHPARWVLVPALLSLVALFAMTMPKKATGQAAAAGKDIVPFGKVQLIIHNRCTPCHASEPYQPGYKIAVAPKGMLLETPQQIKDQAQQIYEQSVKTKVMPFGNMTRMTQEERDTLGLWIEQQGGI
jgi:uncharacterized membrane protein